MLPVVFPQCHRVLQSTMKQTSRQTVVFPGFSLTLHGTDREAATPVETAASCSAVLRDVGLPESRCAQPTHLEVVQIVDTSSLPLFWLSPLHCTLYPPSIHTGCAGAVSLRVSRYTCICIHVLGHVHMHVIGMRDEKEGRKKQARSNTTRQSNTAHQRQMYMLHWYINVCA